MPPLNHRDVDASITAGAAGAAKFTVGPVVITKRSSYDLKRQADRFIRQQIIAEDQKLIDRYPVLRHKEAIAWTFLVGSIVSHFVTATAYYAGALHWSVAVLLSSFLLSTLHEIEHDLMHSIFFGRPARPLHNLGMWIIHLFKFHASPFWRLKWHLRHHAVSGFVGDIEERMLGLGRPMGPIRACLMASPVAFILSIPDILKDNPDFKWWEPLTMSKCFAAWMVLGLTWPVKCMGLDFGLVPVPPALMYLSHVVFICAVVPSHVRHICITISTTLVHYYEDLEKNVVHEQVQIVNPWWMVPLHLFCWNFGANHWIHHFYLQPFWVRTIIAFKINRMAKNSEEWRTAVPGISQGAIRHNDMGVLGRANRRSLDYRKVKTEKTVW